MSLSNEVLVFVREKGKARLKDVYVNFEPKSKDVLRGIVNVLYKRGKLARVGRALYEVV